MKLKIAVHNFIAVIAVQILLYIIPFLMILECISQPQVIKMCCKKKVCKVDVLDCKKVLHRTLKLNRF